MNEVAIFVCFAAYIASSATEAASVQGKGISDVISSKVAEAVRGLVNSNDFRLQVEDYVQAIGARNANCKTMNGEHWYWYHGPECKSCVKACPLGTNSDECWEHCRGYWAELSAASKAKELHETLEKINQSQAVAITFSVISFAIAMLGLALWICFYLTNKNQWRREKTLIQDTYQVKQHAPTGDR